MPKVIAPSSRFVTTTATTISSDIQASFGAAPGASLETYICMKNA
jgi:hypothetical protein